MSIKLELAPRDAAQKLGVSLHFVYQLLWSGKLEGYQVEKQWRIPSSAIEERLSRRGGK